MLCVRPFVSMLKWHDDGMTGWLNSVQYEIQITKWQKETGLFFTLSLRWGKGLKTSIIYTFIVECHLAVDRAVLLLTMLGQFCRRPMFCNDRVSRSRVQQESLITAGGCWGCGGRVTTKWVQLWRLCSGDHWQLGLELLRRAMHRACELCAAAADVFSPESSPLLWQLQSAARLGQQRGFPPAPAPPQHRVCASYLHLLL